MGFSWHRLKRGCLNSLNMPLRGPLSFSEPLDDIKLKLLEFQEHAKLFLGAPFFGILFFVYGISEQRLRRFGAAGAFSHFLRWSHTRPRPQKDLKWSWVSSDLWRIFSIGSMKPGVVDLLLEKGPKKKGPTQEGATELERQSAMVSSDFRGAGVWSSGVLGPVAMITFASSPCGPSDGPCFFLIKGSLYARGSLSDTPACFLCPCPRIAADNSS